MINIPERGQWTAKREENGELVQGYYLPLRDRYFIYAEEMLEEIDPATLEPVTVKPVYKKEWANYNPYCPNCDILIVAVHPKYKYCPNSCGQRLDWSDE